MRQAGRYMASYQALRKRYSFTELCLTPELAAEVTLQPIQAFDFDAAILFSDILFPLKVLGVTPCFEEKEGLRLNGPVWTELSGPTDLAAALKESIGGVYTAASMLVQGLDRPLIGFSGAPWTLAAFLIEGGTSQDFRKARAALQSPQLKSLMKLLEDLVVAHLKLQIEAGCHAIQIFDSRVDLLPPSAVEEYSFAPFRRIVSRLYTNETKNRNFANAESHRFDSEKTSPLLFIGNVFSESKMGFSAKAKTDSSSRLCIPPCPVIFYKARASEYPLVEGTALSFDTSVDLSMVRARLPSSTAIQGNLDPHLLLGPRQELIRQVRQICYSMQEDKGFIFNLANGILPGTDEGAVQCLVETIRETTPKSLHH